MSAADDNRAKDEDAAQVQDESGKYGDKPLGRLSGTGRPPVGDAATQSKKKGPRGSSGGAKKT
jgi:hypothetical protein